MLAHFTRETTERILYIPAYAGMTEEMDSRYPACAGTGSAGMTVVMDPRNDITLF